MKLPLCLLAILTIFSCTSSKEIELIRATKIIPENLNYKYSISPNDLQLAGINNINEITLGNVADEMGVLLEGKIEFSNTSPEAIRNSINPEILNRYSTSKFVEIKIKNNVGFNFVNAVYAVNSFTKDINLIKGYIAKSANPVTNFPDTTYYDKENFHAVLLLNNVLLRNVKEYRETCKSIVHSSTEGMDSFEKDNLLDKIDPVYYDDEKNN